MNSQLSLLIILLVGQLTFGQKEVHVLCETPNTELFHQKNQLTDDKVLLTKKILDYPFIVARKEGFKSRTVIIGNTNCSIPALSKIPLYDIDSLKNIRILNVTSSNKLGDVIGKQFNSPNLELNGVSSGKIVTDYRYLIEPHQLEEILYQSIENLGYSDNLESSIIPSNHSSVYINAELIGIEFNKVKIRSLEYSKIVLVIKWTFASPYSDEKIGFETKSSSDPIYLDNSRSSYNKGITDALEYGLIELFTKDSVQKILTFQNDDALGKNNPRTIIPKNTKDEKSLTESLRSIVRITNSFGTVSSGTILSTNGYIVTDFSAISPTDSSVTVKIDSVEYQGIEVARAELYNLSLIKINVDSLPPIIISEDNKVKLIDKVYALSYSKIKLLNSYATSGRISGIRKLNSIEYYQTDLPLSNGNCGGAVLNERGECIGIISTKVNSFSFEGIGFVLPIEIALSSLNIELTPN